MLGEKEGDLPGQTDLSQAVSRRNFLKTVGLAPVAAAAATSLLPGIASAAPEQIAGTDDSPNLAVRRVDGEWTQPDKVSLGLRMMTRTLQGLDTVALAGKTIIDNAWGNPNLSTRCPIIRDSKFGIRTMTGTSEAVNLLMPGDGDPVNVNFKTTPPVTLTGKPAFRYDEINFNPRTLDKASDFFIELKMAATISVASAIQLVSNRYILPNSPIQSQGPIDGNAVGAYLVACLDGVAPIAMIEDMPPLVIATTFADYLMTPDYKLALDLGLLSDDDQRIDPTLKEGADTFMGTGILVKDNQGFYRWTEGEDRKYRVWLDLVKIQYRRALQLQQSQPSTSTNA